MKEERYTETQAALVQISYFVIMITLYWTTSKYTHRIIRHDIVECLFTSKTITSIECQIES